MRVSVALCTHQGERYLEAQLRSILAQTRPVDEIVIGDDASSDGTAAIIERISSETTIPVHVVRHDPALGVAANFADTITRTTGDVVALSDQDDVWHADRLERLLPALNGVDLVHTDARLVDANGETLGDTLFGALGLSSWERDRMMHGGAFEALLRRNLVTGATVLVRRSAALASLPVPDGWIHDEWIAMVCALGGGVRLVREATVDYRQHGANQIGVARLTLSTALKRLLVAEPAEQSRKIARAQAAAEQAMARGLGTTEQRALLVAKLNHERRRARARNELLMRIPLVLEGIATGRYSRHSRGALDVARDLLALPCGEARGRLTTPESREGDHAA